MSSEGRRDALILLLFTAVAFAVYGGVLYHDFLFNWDDDVYVTGNAAIRGVTPANLRAAFTSFYVGNYAPLQIVSYMFDYAVWGLNPAGYHLTSILLHLANSLLAYRLFLALDSRVFVALPAAVLFLVHPLQVETVAWVAERKTLLAVFFALLAFLSYLRYAGAAERRRLPAYLLMLVLLAAALLSKAVAVVLPLIFVAYDWHAGGMPAVRRGLPDKVLPLVLSGGVAAITVASQSGAGSLLRYIGDNPLNNAMTMLPVFARYLGIIFWPDHLAPIYKPPIKTAVDPEVVLSLLLLAAVLALTGYLLGRRRPAGLAMAIFFLGLLPVAHIFPLPTLMQDRYLYLPLVGFCFAISLGLADVSQMLLRPGAWRFCCFGLMGMSLPLALAARAQAAVWHNAATLWSYTAQEQPRSRQALIMLATTRHDLKDLPGAERAYQELLAVAPKELKGLNGIGVLYGEMGQPDRALSYFEKALAVAPDDPGTLVNFAYAAFLQGRLAEASAAFNRALAINPGLADRVLPLQQEIRRKAGAGFSQLLTTTNAAHEGEK